MYFIVDYTVTCFPQLLPRVRHVNFSTKIKIVCSLQELYWNIVLGFCSGEGMGLVKRSCSGGIQKF